ncbi:MAG: pyridoxal phosphate-dependent aminotransferase [Candidatus Hodarchaeales archaeon]|jgi:aspartate/methionine/tyrosine aminotransferase
MIVKPAKRLDLVSPSGMRTLFDIARQLRARGVDVIDFGLGDLNLQTPIEIRDEIKRILETDPTANRYVSNIGLPELCAAIAGRYKKEYGVAIDPEGGVLTTCGALEACFDVIQAYAEPNSEVIVMDPTFGYFENQAKLAGATVKKTTLKSTLEIDLENLKETITPKTKLFILNFPSNPTSQVITRTDLKSVVEICEDNNIILVSDECYDGLVYEGKHTCALEFGYENTVVICSFSKTYAMTGYRLGYVVGNKELLKNVLLVHQYNTACVPNLIQKAAVKGVKLGYDICKNNFNILNERRIAVIKNIKDLDSLGIKMHYSPKAGFYIFPDVSETGMKGSEFTKKLLDEKAVVVVPGYNFGNAYPDNIRISFGANDKERVIEGIKRIKDFLEGSK